VASKAQRGDPQALTAILVSKGIRFTFEPLSIALQYLKHGQPICDAQSRGPNTAACHLADEISG